MGKFIIDRQIDRFFIVDDDENNRISLKESFVDSSFESLTVDQQVLDIQTFLNETVQQSDAILSDHQMKIKNYFPVNGAEFIATAYKRGIPGILQTRYDKTNIPEIRRFRQFVPVLINPSDLDIDNLHFSLEICVSELRGNFRSDRKLTRTLVRIDAVDDKNVFIIIPGWDSSEIISVDRKELPPEVNAVVDPDKRLHVKTNFGCESLYDLYFSEWEVK